METLLFYFAAEEMKLKNNSSVFAYFGYYFIHSGG